METRDSVLAAIGNTPLIKLRRASEQTGCTILGKAEFMNPGASVKDRAALGIITDAINRGELSRGGLVVDGTAGNTGIGLTIVGNALGLKTVIVIPETQAQEKKDTLRSLGASLIEVPAVPYRNENNYVKVAGRTAARLAREKAEGAIFANQFDNVANRDIHFRTTGPEIWQQTDGKVDGFVSAIGTGGTLAGVAAALRERKPGIAIALADVPGAAMHSFYTTGELKSEGSSITEGIGQGRVTANLEGFRPDHSFFIPRAWPSPSPCSMTKGWRSACRRASMSPERSGWPANLAPVTPSLPCCATRRPVTNRGCSTPYSSAPRASNPRSGSTAQSRSSPILYRCRREYSGAIHRLSEGQTT